MMMLAKCLFFSRVIFMLRQKVKQVRAFIRLVEVTLGTDIGKLFLVVRRNRLEREQPLDERWTMMKISTLTSCPCELFTYLLYWCPSVIWLNFRYWHFYCVPVFKFYSWTFLLALDLMLTFSVVFQIYLFRPRLLSELQKTKAEKKHLQLTLHNFEEQFQREHGRWGAGFWCQVLL